MSESYWSRVQRRLASGVTVRVADYPGRWFYIMRGPEICAQTNNARHARRLYLHHAEAAS